MTEHSLIDYEAKRKAAAQILAEIDLLIVKYNLEHGYTMQHLERDIAELKHKYLEGKQ